MERDYNNNFPPYMDCSMGFPPPNGDINEIYKDPMFNPIAQYEQAYYYYRYLNMQMEYKIKCKEYDKLCGNNNNRKIE